MRKNIRKTVEEIYRKWSGINHTVNSGHPVHDSSEACDFAEYFFNEKMNKMNRRLTIVLIKDKESGYAGYFSAYTDLITQGKTKDEVIDELIRLFKEFKNIELTRDMIFIKKY
jgi:predicted RNase H-like HicB family nuclease